jgi:hypothetical protein
LQADLFKVGISQTAEKTGSCGFGHTGLCGQFRRGMGFHKALILQQDLRNLSLARRQSSGSFLDSEYQSGGH